MSNCKIVDVVRGRKKGEGDFTKIYSPTAEAFVTPLKVLNEKKKGGGGREMCCFRTDTSHG